MRRALDPEAQRAADEYFRTASLGCSGYTDSVCAALLCIVAEYAGTSPREVGLSDGPQLWRLAIVGFSKTGQLPSLPDHVLVNLALGERAAIAVGLQQQVPELPTGGCVDELASAIGGTEDRFQLACRLMVAMGWVLLLAQERNQVFRDAIEYLKEPPAFIDDGNQVRHQEFLSPDSAQ